DGEITVVVANNSVGELLLREELIDRYINTGLKSPSYTLMHKMINFKIIYKFIQTINNYKYDKAFFFEGRPLPITILSIFLNIVDKYGISNYAISSLFLKRLSVPYHTLHKTLSSLALVSLDVPMNTIEAPKLESFNYIRKDSIKIAVISGSATFEKAKRLPYSYYDEIISTVIKQNSSVKFVFFGIEDEKQVLEYIGLENKKYIDEYFGQLTLNQTIEKMAECNIAFGGDSGLMHISASLGLECISVFGPTLSSWISPIGKNVSILKSTLYCAPCYPNKKFGCIDNKCMYEYSVEYIAELLLQKIKSLG
ncbi:MAG: glycosyltransferase family 9 protein, partial [Campylobacterota bacterium]|nr:glycosyltransferase family 9 protein [Campylobacterota bacterium]